MNCMKIPTEQECLELLKQAKIPKHIMEHTLKVTQVATVLAELFIAKGEKINLDLVNAGALLHDIDKMNTLNTGRHGHAGCDFITKKGYAEVGTIIKKHRISSIRGSDPPKTWEEKLVFYADLRVNEAEVVPFKERFEYILKRYWSNSEEKIAHAKIVEDAFLKLEKEIFTKIGRKPEELAEMVH